MKGTVESKAAIEKMYNKPLAEVLTIKQMLQANIGGN